MASESSQPGITVNKGIVGVIATGGNVNIAGDLIVQSSSQEFEVEDFDLPRLITTFRGRELEMQTLDTLFFIQRKKKVAICGLPGFGKTELSKQYANICLQTKKLDKVFWINSDNKDILHRSFRCLKKIYKTFEKTNCLFIFDNSLSRQDIIDYEPPENDKHFLLITSQEKDWGDDVEFFKLEPLSPKSAIKVYQSILSTNYKDEDQDLYEELADVVGNVPLGIQITGAYTRVRIRSLGNDFKLAEYITLLQQSQKEFIDVKLPKSAANTYGRSICGAIKISVDKIRDEEDPEMRDLALNVLCSCSFLHPGFITYDIFLDMRNITEIMATILDKYKLKLAINILDNYLFLDYSPDNKQITIHRFTQEILQFYLGKSESKLQMNCFCSYLDFACNKNNLDNSKNFSKFFHVSHIFRFADNNTSVLSNYCSHNFSKNDEIFKTIINCCVYFQCQNCLINLSEHFGEHIKKYVNNSILIEVVVRLNLLDFLKLLVQNFDVNSTSEGKNTALHIAASRRNLNAIKILIENKADTSLRNAEGNTPLFSFIESYREGYHINLEEIMEICELLNCDENKSITNYMGQTLVHVAAAAGQEQLIKLLTNKYKMNANEKDLQGRTPLHSITLSSASYIVHMKIITEILDIFANINLNDKSASTSYIFDKISENWELVSQYINIMSINIVEDMLSMKEFKVDYKIINCLINYNKKYTGDKNSYSEGDIEILKKIHLLIVQVLQTTDDIISKLEITADEISQKITDFIKMNINDNHWIANATNIMKIKHKKYVEEFGFNNKKFINRFINYNSRYAVPKKSYRSLDKPLDKLTHQFFEQPNLFDIFFELLFKIENIMTNRTDNGHALTYKTLFSEIIQNNINNIEEVVAATRELIKQGASKEIKDKDNKTPLDYAINYKLYYLADIFLFSDKDYVLQHVNLPNNDFKFNFIQGDITEFYLLHKSIVCNKINVLNERGISVKNKNKRGITPLHAAAFHWHLEAIVNLIANNADINARSDYGETPLFYIIRGLNFCENINKEKINLAFKLLKLKQNQNVTNNEGDTLMDIAVTLCHNTELLNLLVICGLDVNSKNEYQATPLHAAALNWNLPAMKFLVEQKANRIATDSEGETALFYFIRSACQRKDMNVDEVNEIFDLLKMEEHKNATNHNGYKLMCIAAALCHNTELLNLLLLRGLEINSKNKYHATPLHTAASHWNLPAIKFLVKHKANRSVTDHLGETVLFRFIRSACKRKDINVHEINEIFDLLKLEENLTITNTNGETLIHLVAAMCQNTELLNLLQQRGFDVNRQEFVDVKLPKFASIEISCFTLFNSLVVIFIFSSFLILLIDFKTEFLDNLYFSRLAFIFFLKLAFACLGMIIMR